MRYFCALLGAILVSSCSQTPGAMPSSGGSGDQGSRFYQGARLAGSGPSIRKVSKIKAKQTQKITISGDGFGTMQPYDGDSAYLQILDTTGGWSAGYESSSQIDTVTLDVTAWSKKKIVISGFTGGYGESYWTLHKGDQLEINVWNAQSGDGPATIDTTVK